MKSLLQYFIMFNYLFIGGENWNAIFMELSSKRLDIIFLVCYIINLTLANAILVIN